MDSKQILENAIEELAQELHERVIRKKVVRGGKVKFKKTSNLANFKIQDGQEVRMSPQEMRKRRKSAKKSARKRKSKKALIAARRKRSMRLRTF